MELVWLRSRLDDELPVRDDDICTTIGELGSDVLVRVGRILGLNDDGIGAADSGGMNWEDRLKFGFGGVQAGGAGSVWSHCRYLSKSYEFDGRKSVTGYYTVSAGVFVASVGIVSAPELVREHAQGGGKGR